MTHVLQIYILACLKKIYNDTLKFYAYLPSIVKCSVDFSTQYGSVLHSIKRCNIFYILITKLDSNLISFTMGFGQFTQFG